MPGPRFLESAHAAHLDYDLLTSTALWWHFQLCGNCNNYKCSCSAVWDWTIGSISAVKRGQSQLLAEPASEGNAQCHLTTQGSSNPCFQWEEPQGLQAEGSTESSHRHLRWQRLRTAMDMAQCTHPPTLIPPVRRFDQCRFCDQPNGLLFLHSCLSVWHTFPLGWRLPACTAILFLPPSSHNLCVCMDRHKTACRIF